MATQEEMLLALAAIENGYITREQVQKCLDIQKAMKEKGIRHSLVELLQHRKYLTKAQMQSVLYEQVLKAGPEEGSIIKGYRILEKKARGGTATVFLAGWLVYDCLVALKILHPKYCGTARMVNSFLNEAHLLCYLNCENIVKGYQYGKSRSLYFAAMEYVNGISVQKLIDRYGGVEETAALCIVLQIAKTLSYLDSQGIVHRDIKPGNVLIDRDGRCILCDLGFAKAADQKDYLLKEGVTCGTAAYISPEQAMGETDLDVRSDIYALGVTLYHLILGDVPFRGSQTEVIAQQVLGSLAASTREKMSPRLYGMVCKMMAKDRNARYQSAGALALDIEKALAESGESEEDIRRSLPGDFALLFPSIPDLPNAGRSRELREDQNAGKFRRTVGLRSMKRKR